MNKEEIICVKIKNQLLEQMIDILAVDFNQISWKLMSSHYIYNFDCYKRIITLKNANLLKIH